MLWTDCCCGIVSDAGTNGQELHRSRLHRVQVGVGPAIIIFPLPENTTYYVLYKTSVMYDLCFRALVSEVPELRAWLRSARVCNGKVHCRHSFGDLGHTLGPDDRSIRNYAHADFRNESSVFPSLVPLYDPFFCDQSGL